MKVGHVERAVEDVAERTRFSGVVGVVLADGSSFATRFGLADRRIGEYRERMPTSTSVTVTPVPVHELATTEDRLSVLDGHPTVFPAGERFSYAAAATASSR